MNISSIASASAQIEQAMQLSEKIARQAAEEHLQAFTAQMREKLGIDSISLDEPYLPFLLVRSQLRFLRRMVMLEQRLTGEKFATLGQSCCTEFKEDTLPVSAQIDSETNRLVIETKQDLDAARQQAFGIRQYIWGGGSCSQCSPKNGRIYGWDAGTPPGSVHPNCNCSADPILENAGDPNPPEINGSDIADMAVLLASLIPFVRAGKIGVSAVRSLGQIGSRVLARLNKTPPSRTLERPKNVPKDWVEIPSNKGEGIRYRDPKNPHNEVRVQKGNPEVSNPMQKRDYVRWKKNGQWLDKYGKPSINPQKTHIPLEDFNFDPEIFK